MSENQLREHIVRYAHSMFERGLTAGSSGNISAWTGDGWLMTPTNSSFGNLDPSRLSKLSQNGEHIAGDPPTKEAFLHQAFYNSRPGTAAVVHVHSTYSVAISCLADTDPTDVLPPLTAYYIMRIGKLPLIPYFPPGDLGLAEAVATEAKDHRAVLLANHGPVVSGHSLSDATNALEELEETAKLYFLLKDHSTRTLSATQVSALHEKFPQA